MEQGMVGSKAEAKEKRKRAQHGAAAAGHDSYGGPLEGSLRDPLGGTVCIGQECKAIIRGTIAGWLRPSAW